VVLVAGRGPPDGREEPRQADVSRVGTRRVVRADVVEIQAAKAPRDDRETAPRAVMLRLSEPLVQEQGKDAVDLGTEGFEQFAREQMDMIETMRHKAEETLGGGMEVLAHRRLEFETESHQHQEAMNKQQEPLDASLSDAQAAATSTTGEEKRVIEASTAQVDVTAARFASIIEQQLCDGHSIA